MVLHYILGTCECIYLSKFVQVSNLMFELRFGPVTLRHSQPTDTPERFMSTHCIASGKRQIPI